ncbi:DUF3592 domain-containing protein [Actinocrispum wychmicini]|uniref:Uncharacterized protein n=1 Tax=Actinocrispum wychmicini TaxID=1213861 RepID=A0A4R2J2D6_9PSEU|nr:DUF3592 domain-containing protein [Actinocrispum wychmicini]TCO52471.1 hypothetical protein EV192_112203 [Actinocrispum wychmicini]
MARYVQESSAKLGGRFGPGSRVTLYVMAVVVWLTGPIVLAFAVVVEGNRWVPLVVGCVVAVGTIPLGWVIWGSTSRRVAETRRLEREGVLATAEIVAVRDTDMSGMVGVELRLRISGEGFAPFEATVECTDEPDLRVGTQLTARVDPADRLFMIVR